MTNESQLDKYLDKGIYQPCDGEYVTLEDFMRDFHEWLVRRKLEPAAWDRQRCFAGLKAHFPVGAGSQNQTVIGNISKTRTRPYRYELQGKKVRLV
jgi:hypothetical protein